MAGHRFAPRANAAAAARPSASALPLLLLVTALLAPALPALPAPQVGGESRGWDVGDNEGDEPQVLLSAARRSFDPLGRLQAAGARVRRPMPVSLDPLQGVTFGSAHKRSMEPVGLEVSQSKRNFDEIDRIGFNEFMKKKKNVDEIDRSPFEAFVKRRMILDAVLEDLLEHRYANANNK